MMEGASLIFLDTMIDKKKTIAITKRYLKQYPRMKTIARTTTTLQSNWNVSDKVKSGSTRNTQEDRLLNAIAVSQEVEEIERTISNLDKLHSDILTEKYIKRQKADYGIYQDMNMSESGFYKALQTALLDFACIFKNGELLQYKDGG
ncbi:ArpU family phage packaging/lysis transcriptional regulator [Streptococcus ruminantium]|uniref:ArpU family phage packaging/lysis transcriptional regulator n=1 Tax=Streptococcus ruminantium TaxID=1917441 RepID=A0ABU1B687_9STRE|nr:ArpU family phage packaging/lysis transcriptional regulator [Streptococcus ruminantium]MDQ8760224.1 ArpU family phage packaging/lysis transcriptional regulator [Streptococcus ruminantium]MDQ8765923.1 ArpU family phage packaging/lysis transcriptional regulator [Streptococcus ruminantium]MDQ8766369.1 ArpU family phage packaging/lysis transcriptional regulator [Streptococcus ruminantium]MDQ8769825.1 ArpU family phage packaging/lysis transcriptional regulator [Streptococcus ruminantium]MDQ87755